MTNIPPSVFFRVVPKQGDNDCAIASLAWYLRRAYAEVLIAAAHICPTVWTAGLSCPEMIRVAKRLGVKAKWLTTFDIEDDIGLLWVSYNDSAKEHIVCLAEGWVLDPDHDPVVMAQHEDWMKVNNAYPKALMQVCE